MHALKGIALLVLVDTARVGIEVLVDVKRGSDRALHDSGHDLLDVLSGLNVAARVGVALSVVLLDVMRSDEHHDVARGSGTVKVSLSAHDFWHL